MTTGDYCYVGTFPLSWDEWRHQWDAYEATSGLRRSRTNPWTDKSKNFLADDVLGVYRASNGRIVELSEVTFPNLSERDENGNLIHDNRRYIGFTFDDGYTGLVRSFAELELEIGPVAA